MLRIIIILTILQFIAGIKQGFASPTDTVYIYTTETVYDTVYETIIIYDTTGHINIEKLDNPFIPMLIGRETQRGGLPDTLCAWKNAKIPVSRNTRRDYPGKSKRIKNGRNFFEPIMAAFRHLFEPRPLPVADYRQDFQKNEKDMQSNAAITEDTGTKNGMQRGSQRQYWNRYPCSSSGYMPEPVYGR